MMDVLAGDFGEGPSVPRPQRGEQDRAASASEGLAGNGCASPAAFGGKILETRLREELLAQAQLRLPITYAALAERIAVLATMGAIRNALERLMDDDADEGRPFLVAVAVQTLESGLPSPWFFRKAESIGLFTGDAANVEAYAFHAREFHRAVLFHARPSHDVDFRERFPPPCIQSSSTEKQRPVPFGMPVKEVLMDIRSIAALAALCLLVAAPFAQAADKPTDPQIAHIAYTAGVIDIEAAKLAIEKSKNQAVIEFAESMVRDHEAVNVQALDLVKKLNVTPEDNDTSKALTQASADERAKLEKLDGAAFDQAYVDNEVAYHKQVNGALETLLIPSAQNAELKSLLETGLKLFQGHQQHAEHVAASLK